MVQVDGYAIGAAVDDAAGQRPAALSQLGLADGAGPIPLGIAKHGQLLKKRVAMTNATSQITAKIATMART